MKRKTEKRDFLGADGLLIQSNAFRKERNLIDAGKGSRVARQFPDPGALWFPDTFVELMSNPQGTCWAGRRKNYVEFFAEES